MAEEKAKENLWYAILNEQKPRFRKLVSNKSLLVLGDNGTGKTSLIAKLQGKKPPKHGAGLEYAYIDVEDDSNGDKAQLGVWTMDGDTGHTSLLALALNVNNFEGALVMLTVSMTEPWTWPEQLNHWINVLEGHIESLPLAAEQKEAARKQLATKWQSYCYPGSSLKQTSVGLNSAIDGDDLLPLTEDELTTNLGVDLVVVVTKTDCMAAAFQLEHDYRDEHFDFMQQWIRKFCLRHGAALFYTSIKKATNCDYLQKYLLHRVYGLPFQTPPMVAEPDAVCVPAGWDTLKKIDILSENNHGIQADSDYTDVIRAPYTGNGMYNRDLEFVETVDEQAFLARQLEILKRLDQEQAQGGGDTIHRTHRTSTGLRSTIITDSPESAGGEGILAKFFSSLLQKKAATSTADGSESGRNDTEKLAVPLDPSADLDRFSSNWKKADPKKPEEPQQNMNEHEQTKN
ncbi:cytoplasmic dynein 1 light intermediate chain 1-like [Drosophila obscura]|uniref:cytoplasmic dynein 1 light intermediate chain 1-like n=1 Tax=Drosophila obscura TaxID=7282 RepID=UPI001BB19619|nr:cytoplasmic dynein 1 light intermediate chain 1-like [Drosophila obscura]